MPLVPHVAPGQIVASSWGNNVADQVVMRFTTAAQRASQLPAPLVDQLTSRDDRPGVIERWNGTAWVELVTPRELSYTQITTNKTVTATVETSADAVVQAAAMTFDGSTAVLIELSTPAALPPAVAGAHLMVWLYQDGVSLGRMASVFNPAAAQLIVPVHAVRRMTPTAGSHIFAFAATVSGASGTVAAGPGGVGQYVPTYLRISRAL